MVSKITLKLVLICSLICMPALAAKKKSKNIIYDDLSATVKHIIDGDTFSAKVGLENGAEISVKVRILNIDAPEMSGKCDSEIKWANQSKNKLATLIPVDSQVILTNIKDDKYLGRIDANVSNGNFDVGRAMMDANMARPYNGGKRQPWCN